MRSSGSGTEGESDRLSAALLEPPLASLLLEFSDIANLLIEAVTESASDILKFNMSSCQSLIQSDLGLVKQNQTNIPLWSH